MSIDAFLVPGSGLTPDGGVPPWVENRLEYVLSAANGSERVILLSAGTVYKPGPRDERGFTIFESVAAARWLLRRGFDASRLGVETASYDTVGNAWFARVMHTDPAGWRRLRVVTSEFHMPRAEAVFGWVFGLPRHGDGARYEIDFTAVPDLGMADGVRAARIRKEREALERLRPKMREISSLSALHGWMNTQHAAYAPAQWESARPRLPPELLSSY